MNNQSSEHLIGCNYWASNSAIYMWRNYDKEVIEKDVKLLSSYGVNCLRVFPLWPDFQPLTSMRFVTAAADERTCFKMRTGDLPLALNKFPDSGLAPEQVENFKHFLSVTEKYNVKVIVSFITGWMSGRKLVPEPFIDRDLVKDAEVVLYECAFIRDLIGEIKDCKSIIAYEPGNETNCLSFEVDKFQAELWIKTICDTIRLADPMKPICAGIHGTGITGRWGIDMLGKHFDVLTPHPYPLFTEYCRRERLTAMRASLHAEAEMSYYRSIGRKPSMVQEIGVMGDMFMTTEGVPEYFEKACMTSFAAGSKGFLWWCAFEQDHLDFCPYDVQCCEAILGVAYADHTPKPVLEKLAEIRKAIDEIGDLPNPVNDACLIQTRNLDQWAIVYASHMMGVQTGYRLDYVYEEQPMKDYEYYISAGLNDTMGLNKYMAKDLYERVKNGAKLLVTFKDGSMWDFEKVCGLRIFGNEAVNHVKTFEINGKTLSIPCCANLYLEPTTAKVLIRDTEGRIVLTENQYGKGSVMFLNAPIENVYAEMNYPEETDLCEVYRLFFKDIKKPYRVNSKKAFTTLYDLGNGKFGGFVYNYQKTEKELPIEIAEGFKVTKCLFGAIENGKIKFERNYVYFEIQK